MAWPIIWALSAAGGALWGLLFGAIPVDFAIQLLLLLAQAVAESDDSDS